MASLELWMALLPSSLLHSSILNSRGASKRVSEPLITEGYLSRGSVIQTCRLVPIPLEIRPSLWACDCFNSTNKWSENKDIGRSSAIIMSPLYAVEHRESVYVCGVLYIEVVSQSLCYRPQVWIWIFIFFWTPPPPHVPFVLSVMFSPFLFQFCFI